MGPAIVTRQNTSAPLGRQWLTTRLSDVHKDSLCKRCHVVLSPLTCVSHDCRLSAICTSIEPSESRRTIKGNSAVVLIGVRRGSVGRENSPRWRLPHGLGSAAEVDHIGGSFTELPRCGTLRTSRVLDSQGGGCRVPLTEVKLLSLPNKTSKVHPPSWGSERDVSLKQQDSKRLVMDLIR
jgi:hypothetical protein